jgi:hypothetical protein
MQTGMKRKRIERIFQRAGYLCECCGELRASRIVRVRERLRYLDGLEVRCDLCAKKPGVVEVLWRDVRFS